MWFVFVLFGLITGLLGAMGLGGGTVLIPLLSLVGVGQKEAQLINVLSFVIMALFILIFNIKNKLIDVFPVLAFSVVAVPFAIVVALCVQGVNEQALKIVFGIFLLVMGGYELFCYLKKYYSKS
ncbi:MAG: TSUP family transporter [Christensenellales bacterium]